MHSLSNANTAFPNSAPSQNSLYIHCVPPIFTTPVHSNDAAPFAQADPSIFAHSAPIVCYFTVPIAMWINNRYADEFVSLPKLGEAPSHACFERIGSTGATPRANLLYSSFDSAQWQVFLEEFTALACRSGAKTSYAYAPGEPLKLNDPADSPKLELQFHSIDTSMSTSPASKCSSNTVADSIEVQRSRLASLTNSPRSRMSKTYGIFSR